MIETTIKKIDELEKSIQNSFHELEKIVNTGHAFNVPQYEGTVTVDFQHKNVYINNNGWYKFDQLKSGPYHYRAILNDILNEIDDILFHVNNELSVGYNDLKIVAQKLDNM